MPGLRLAPGRRHRGEHRARQETHAWLQESWLKRQLKMKLPSLSSSKDVKVSGSRDRMLM